MSNAAPLTPEAMLQALRSGVGSGVGSGVSTGVSAGRWSRLDLALARLLHEQFSDVNPLSLLGAAIVSAQFRQGQVCLDLAALSAEPERFLPLSEPGHPVGDPHAAEPGRLLAWLRSITLDQWVAQLGDDRIVASGAGGTPLVLEHDTFGARLYLRRCWNSEQRVRSALQLRLQAQPLPALHAEAGVQRALAHWFPSDSAGAPDAARWACAVALRRALCVITGGPGTGKTSAVVKILAVLQSLALASPQGQPLRVLLAAPTGKAAQRLGQSVRSSLANLPQFADPNAAAIKACMPQTASTVHRLLADLPKAGGDDSARLAADVVVVDEASMLDLALMDRLLAALPAQCRLVLLGDKDQLASVEAGGVLSEVCKFADSPHFWPESAADLTAIDGRPFPAEWIASEARALDQTVVLLKYRHRFDGQGAIGQLTDAVHSGDPSQMRSLLGGGYAALRHVRAAHTQGEFWNALLGSDSMAGAMGAQAHAGDGLDQSTKGYRAALRDIWANQPSDADRADAWDLWARQALDVWGQFQVLCALRQGPYGVESINRGMAERLWREGLLSAPTGWVAGRPVMVTKNNSALGVMNGDLGLTLPRRAATSALDGGRTVTQPAVLSVAFGSADGGIRWVAPARLAQVETAFAMTVHKAQGSEFSTVALVLPDRASPVLTRELVYTGVTRSRKALVLIEPGSSTVLDRAITSTLHRTGGPLSE